jgi:molybdopterin-guanine dinucleotide biosynthesis protein A
VLVDDDVGFAGPLAGIARALRELESGWLATVPVDALPCPRDWVARLLALPADDHPRIRVAHDGVRRQALFALYPHVVAAPIRACYLSGVRAVWRAQDACGCVELRFAEGEGAFGNRNEC